MRRRNVKVSGSWLAAVIASPLIAAPAGAQASQTTQAEPPPAAVKTIQEAIEQLKHQRPGKSSPARPLGDVADYFGPDAYPPAALRALEQGRSVVRVDVDVRGYPTGCTVMTSSGSTALDDETCRIAQLKMQFAPARDQKGKPIASQYTLPVRWQLPEDAPEVDVTNGRKVLINVTIEVALDVEGNVSSCKVITQEPKTVDACAGYPVGRAANLQPMRNGGPSPARMTVVHRVYVDQP